MRLLHALGIICTKQCKNPNQTSGTKTDYAFPVSNVANAVAARQKVMYGPVKMRSKQWQNH